MRVQPRASLTRLLGWREGELRVAVQSPPVDGAANAALEAFLAEVFEVSRRAVRIVVGAGARSKIVEVEEEESLCRERLERAFLRSSR